MVTEILIEGVKVFFSEVAKNFILMKFDFMSYWQIV